MPTPTQSQPRAMPSAFDRFYEAPSPLGAVELAISDAIHGKQSQEFYAELCKARDALTALADAVRLLLPYAEAKASVNEITGWESGAQSAVDSARKTLAIYS